MNRMCHNIYIYMCLDSIKIFLTRTTRSREKFIEISKGFLNFFFSAIRQSIRIQTIFPKSAAGLGMEYNEDTNKCFGNRRRN